MVILTRKVTSALVGLFAVTLMAAGIGQTAQIHKAHPKSAKTGAQITVAQANAAALREIPGKIAGKTKLENENGSWQYSITVKSGKRLHEVMVNARTGKVTPAEASVGASHKSGLRPMRAKRTSMHKTQNTTAKGSARPTPSAK